MRAQEPNGQRLVRCDDHESWWSSPNMSREAVTVSTREGVGLFQASQTLRTISHPTKAGNAPKTGGNEKLALHPATVPMPPRTRKRTPSGTVQISQNLSNVDISVFPFVRHPQPVSSRISYTRRACICNRKQLQSIKVLTQALDYVVECGCAPSDSSDDSDGGSLVTCGSTRSSTESPAPSLARIQEV